MRVLAISDCHEPFMHRDGIAFLKAVAKKYKTELTVCLGDEIDSHAISVHDTDPDGLSPGNELTAAVAALKAGLYTAFPRALVCTSNHTSRYFRQALRAGIPKAFLKEYRDALQAPKGWTWADDWTIDDVMYTHGEHANSEINALSAAFRMGKSTVQGHVHSKGCIVRGRSRTQSLFAMIAGCLINFDTYAFRYAKGSVARPFLGTGVVLDGRPYLEEMTLDKHGRWTGEL